MIVELKNFDDFLSFFFYVFDPILFYNTLQTQRGHQRPLTLLESGREYIIRNHTKSCAGDTSILEYASKSSYRI